MAVRRGGCDEIVSPLRSAAAVQAPEGSVVDHATSCGQSKQRCCCEEGRALRSGHFDTPCPVRAACRRTTRRIRWVIRVNAVSFAETIFGVARLVTGKHIRR